MTFYPLISLSFGPFSSLVAHIRTSLKEFSEWRIAWVLRRCNVLAHLLVKWASNVGVSGLSLPFVISEYIRICDMLFSIWFLIR